MCHACVLHVLLCRVGSLAASALSVMRVHAIYFSTSTISSSYRGPNMSIKLGVYNNYFTQAIFRPSDAYISQVDFEKYHLMKLDF